MLATPLPGKGKTPLKSRYSIIDKKLTVLGGSVEMCGTKTTSFLLHQFSIQFSFHRNFGGAITLPIVPYLQPCSISHYKTFCLLQLLTQEED